MRFVFSIFAIWLAIVLVPDRQTSTAIEEKVWLSRTCTGSKWYLEDSDDVSVTLECWPQQDEGN